MSALSDNLQAVNARLEAAAQQAGRPSADILLLAVSKTFPASTVREAAALGLHQFGENYVQEGCDKVAELADLRARLTWHFIGPLQSNKTRRVAELFDWVHGIDRLKIAQRLSEQRPQQLPPLQVLIQVNVSGEASKSGVPPEALTELAQAVAALPRLALRGLMAIPAPEADPVRQREPFARLRTLRDALQDELGLPLPVLSMGMSGDLEAAITEGSTLVRVGTALFGSRPAKSAGPPETA